MSSLNFKGKSAVWNHHLSVPYHTLDKEKKSSLSGINENENLIIEGDNLLALKALLPKYQGKIKCIYIDPPYNTGNEGWVYNDNVNNPLIKDWIGQTVGKEGEDLTRHDKWLCMMTPRLKLLRELLSEDGAIFISIDINEVHRLQSLCDEVFNGNFVEQIIVQTNPRGSQSSIHFANTHEYILVYAKDKDKLSINGLEKDEEDYEDYNLEDDKGRYRLLGLRQRGGAWRREDRPNMFYPIYVNPDDGKVSLEKSNKYKIECIPKRPTGEEGRWTWSKNKLKNEIELLVGKKVNRRDENDFWDISRKDYIENEDGEERQTKIKTIWAEKMMNYQNGRTAIKELFDGKDLFDYPKPVELIKRCILANTDKNSIVLDSFSGSGTTAQSLLELNNYDGGNRKFILIQIQEEIKQKSGNGGSNPAYEAGYRWVHEITRDRVKKVIKLDEIDTGFTYYKLGPSIDGKNILEGKKLPTWDNFAKYVHYLATGNPIDEVKKPNNTWEIISKTKNTGVYLIYKDNIDELKNLAITRDWLETVKGKDSKKIVYAPACFLDKEVLDEHNISFVQIPFNLFRRG